MGANNQNIRRNQSEVRQAPVVRRDPPRRENPRLSGYVQFKVNDQIIDFIQVNKTRLYFKAYNQQQTVKTLQEQYRLFHKKKMKLQNEVIKISPNMPISQIVSSTFSRQVFEEIATKIDKHQTISIADIPVEKKEIYETIINKCNEFHRYDGKIHMNVGPEEPMRLGLDVKQDTTFNKIINMLNEYPQVIGNDIQFEDDQGQIIDRKLYDVPFEELQITSSFFNARFSCKNSLVRAGTLISVFGVSGNEVMIERFENHKDINLMSYDAEKNRVVFNDLTNFKKEKINKYFEVTLILKLQLQKDRERKEILLEATGSYRVCVLNRDFEYVWMPISRLKTYPYIGVVGIDKESQSVVLYDVKSIENRYLTHPQFFYGIETVPSHQYIANSIIVHNSDTYTINTYNLNDKQKMKQIFHRNQKLSEFFKDKICDVGGHILNNNHTFGDYQLDKISIMHIYDKGKGIPKRKQRTISEWKGDTIQLKELDEKNNKRIQNKLGQYYGIYDHKIIPYSEIKKMQDAKDSKIINIFVAYRVYIQRMHYFLNLEPKFSKFQDKVYDKFKDLEPQCKQKLKYTDKQGVDDKSVLAIYLYASNLIYDELNRYLRDFSTSNLSSNDEQYLPLTSWITKSTMKARRYQGEGKPVFRGVGDLSLQKAFGLDLKNNAAASKNVEQSNIIDTKEWSFKKQAYKQEKIVLFSSFTSTSIEKDKAMKFSSQQGVFMTIYIQNGYQIQPYSPYGYEKEILILPFTYFVLNSYDASERPHKAELQEIPMPRGTSQKIIFWVDDNPEGNHWVIQQDFKPQGIEVVQVTSTRIMTIIISNFFGLFKLLGKKIVFISDMVRKEKKKMNYTAGVDLFQQIYENYGLSNKAIIYTMDKEKAMESIKKKIQQGKWAVVTCQSELFSEVMAQFQKM